MRLSAKFFDNDKYISIWQAYATFFYNIAYKDSLAVKKPLIFCLLVLLIYTDTPHNTHKKKQGKYEIRISTSLFRLNYSTKQKSFHCSVEQKWKAKTWLFKHQSKEQNRKTNKPLLAISGGILLVEKQWDCNISETTEVWLLYLIYNSSTQTTASMCVRLLCGMKNGSVRGSFHYYSLNFELY